MSLLVAVRVRRCIPNNQGAMGRLQNGYLPQTQNPHPSNLSGAAMALEIAEAVAALARQQLDMEQRYTTMADYMRGFVQQVSNRSP